jgi:hypothetical protein
MNLDLAGYHLTYDQEFTLPRDFAASPSGTTGFKTQYDWGGRTVPTNHEAEFYSDPSLGVNPFRVAGGVLTITAQAARPGANTQGMPYTSGMITTQNSFAQHGGYFEMRAKVAGGQGLWPAFWLLPATLKDYPEMDIMEDPNLGPGTMYWLHATGTSAGGGGFFDPGPALAGGYHRYGVEWNDHTVTFYFDQQAVSMYATPPDFAGLKMYMIANLAVGGVDSWPGTPGPGSIPAQYRIDYIRVFSDSAGDRPVAMQRISSPDGVNTRPVMHHVPEPTVVTGAGPQTLVLNTAEQWFDGDAQFTVSIDGVQQGGVFTTIAPQRRGETQQFVFNGRFAPGVHTVAVTFLNDAYGGSTWLDRNLYVQGAAVNGVAVPGSTLALGNNGTQAFSFTVTGAETETGTGTGTGTGN